MKNDPIRNADMEQTEESKAPATRYVSAVAHDAIDGASQKAGKLEKRLRAEAEGMAEKSSETAREAKKQVDETLQRVDRFVKDKPFASAGIAFAAGALTVFLLRK